MKYGRFFTYMCVCVCVCIYIYIYTHTHTHTYIFKFVMGCITCDKLQWKIVLEGTDLLLWDRLICVW